MVQEKELVSIMWILGLNRRNKVLEQMAAAQALAFRHTRGNIELEVQNRRGSKPRRGGSNW